MSRSKKEVSGNLIRKWAVVDAKDIARTETWLEDMAAQGLFFHDFSGWSILAPGPLWVVLFQVDVPKPRRRYRLCPARPQEAEPTQETLELYAQSGWQFLRYWGTSCVSYYLFYSDDPAAPEPYTDPDSLYEALRPPKKDVLNDLLLGVVLYTSAVILSATQILDRQLSFLPNWILAAAAALLIALWLISLLLNGTDWLTVLALRQEIRRRDTVRPAPPPALFAARCLFSSLLSLLQTGLLAVVLALIFTLFRINSDLPLEQFAPDFDLLTLSEMEGDGSWTPEPDFVFRGEAFPRNTADTYQDPSLGVQTWYRVRQAGWGSSGDSDMELNYYIADDPQAARELLTSLVQDLQSPDGELLSYLPDQLPFQRETVPGSEEFLVRREGENWDVAALEGDRVLALRYGGTLDLTEWYGDIAAMLMPEA
ncbi:MAG: DUF2812 domain-containing protein [Oscillospiraceae bacterium]|nr:DUF2812 domain-containing protein [Oscillospiraceae bacterium]